MGVRRSSRAGAAPLSKGELGVHEFDASGAPAPFPKATQGSARLELLLLGLGEVKET